MMYNINVQTYILSSNNSMWACPINHWTTELKCNNILLDGNNKMLGDMVKWLVASYIPMFTDYDVCHATAKVILDCCSPDLRGCTLYTLFFPCNKCALVIIQSGMKEFVHYNDEICPFHEGFYTKEEKKKDEQGEKKRASVKLLDHARVFYK